MEYSIILALLALVVVVVLVMFGPQVSDFYSQAVDAFNVGDGEINEEPIEEPTEEPTDVVLITLAHYDSVNQRLHLHAISDGGADTSVTLTASPGGVMDDQYGNFYHIYITLMGCPCEVTVTSSEGGSAAVTVGP